LSGHLLSDVGLFSTKDLNKKMEGRKYRFWLLVFVQNYADTIETINYVFKPFCINPLAVTDMLNQSFALLK